MEIIIKKIVFYVGKLFVLWSQVSLCLASEGMDILAGEAPLSSPQFQFGEEFTPQKVNPFLLQRLLFFRGLLFRKVNILLKKLSIFDKMVEYLPGTCISIHLETIFWIINEQCTSQITVLIAITSYLIALLLLAFHPFLLLQKYRLH